MKIPDMSSISARIIDQETRDKARQIYAVLNKDFIKFGGLLSISGFIRALINELHNYMKQDGRLAL